MKETYLTRGLIYVTETFMMASISIYIYLSNIMPKDLSPIVAGGSATIAIYSFVRAIISIFLHYKKD